MESIEFRMTAKKCLACSEMGQHVSAWLALGTLIVGFVLPNLIHGSEALPGTGLLESDSDLASELVSGVDQFLLRKLDESRERRAQHWDRDFSSTAAYERSISKNRERLKHILGLRDQRVDFDAPELIASVGQSAEVGRGNGFRILKVKWPTIGDVFAEGLLLEPERVVSKTQGEGVGIGVYAVPDAVLAIPDADQTPEQLVGLTDGIPLDSQFARRLAESGCRVLIPSLVSRGMERRHSPGRQGGANLTHREFLYRSAFELGRHIVGYELQKVLAGVDWFEKESGPGAKIGVIGYGEGGMLALYAGAVDARIRSVCVSGYFEERERIWDQPISRNVFGLLEQFGDAELAAMIAPRSLVVEASVGPELVLPSEGGAPARLTSPKLESVRSEIERARSLVASLDPTSQLDLIEVEDRDFGSERALFSFLQSLGQGRELSSQSQTVESPYTKFDEESRLKRQIYEMNRHNQQLLTESAYVRKEFMSRLKTDSLSDYETSAEEYRTFFYDEVVGRFDDPVLPANPRSRKVYDEEKWVGYEVVMDVYPDVMAYGILCLPKDLKAGERRPVVVCQHGLEGRPQDIVAGDHGAYHDFASKLAERGFVTFSPQNLYIFQDRFRTLQRKANPLKKTLFSVIVPQHQQIVDWLKTQDFVDAKRIAFYGLSYGGKTAMRVPAIVTDYCLSICSADFNEWVWKNASTRSPYSYVWTGEYEIFEFDLGSTFNYSEMAALIAPRPFMVERGHFDGVAPDETVGYEFGKVRNLYAARLGISDRCEIEWFVGPHTINGKGTYSFLNKHLDWPRR